MKRRTSPVRRRPLLRDGRKRVLVVLFIPSAERDGATPVDQQHRVDAALEMFGRVFGGATAELGSFCRMMGRDARQGEVGLVVGDEYFAIRELTAE